MDTAAYKLLCGAIGKRCADAGTFCAVDLNVSDEQLIKISKDGMLALSLDEMKSIRGHFATPEIQAQRKTAGMPAAITNVELEILAQTWSEHCKHKIFKCRYYLLRKRR